MRIEDRMEQIELDIKWLLERAHETKSRLAALKTVTRKTYEIKVGCRNCGSSNEITITKGTPAQVGVQGVICDNCGLLLVPKQQPKPAVTEKKGD